ncbi:CpsD/CapB family tyrosine-protein kinase [uncultured Deinococcus sp.]|uniref:CpsD/CapB family tyrosine-protein kinase n=1 Tax=uncultured Deinococcus sp. TaxID=158789 RepID=UPI002583201A|nr:CpsD/CapB family tyrosine-protein kinase [uncultured Deinococcus sp.]
MKHYFSVLRRSAWIILGGALLGGALTYGASSLRPAEYEASTSLAALSGSTGNSVVSLTLVTTPPLPQSVVQNALRSQKVLDLTLSELRGSALPAAEKTALAAQLRAEAAGGRYQLVRMLASIDPQQQTGIYELRSHARTPQAAQVLADASAQALLLWDQERAAQNITRAQQTLRQQLANVDARLGARPGTIETQSLLTTRSDLQEKLGQVSALLTAVGGTLSLISPASTPQVPVSPRPLRDALLVFAALLFFLALGAIVLDALRKRVNSAADLAPLGKPLLGVLPLLRDGQTELLAETRGGALYEQVGFLRVNLASVAAGRTRFAVSSARPGEGKSTITAALAQSFALRGLRVLIVDADLYRPTQFRLWQRTRAHFTSTAVGGATLYQDLTPGAGSGATDLLIPERGVNDAAKLYEIISSLADDYAYVLVDTPPVLVAASALELSARLGGVLMVAALGSELELVERAMRSAQTAGSEVLGIVLNKEKERAGNVGYGYAPGRYMDPESPEAAPLELDRP